MLGRLLEAETSWTRRLVRTGVWRGFGLMVEAEEKVEEKVEGAGEAVWKMERV